MEHSPLYQAVSKTLSDLQTKEGRVLSGKNRTLISDAITQLNETITALQALLDATEPKDES